MNVIDIRWAEPRGRKLLHSLWHTAKTIGEVSERIETQFDRNIGEPLIRDWGYDAQRRSEIPEKSIAFIRNPLIYEPVFLILFDLIRTKRLGNLQGIESAFFFSENNSFGVPLLKTTLALELFLLLLSGNDTPYAINNVIGKASSAVRENQYQGVYFMDHRAGSIIVVNGKFSNSLNTLMDGTEPEEIRFFPFKGSGFISFEEGTVEYTVRTKNQSRIVVHPSCGESERLPVPEGSGELYFCMDMLEVLTGMKSEPIIAQRILPQAVLRAEEFLG